MRTSDLPEGIQRGSGFVLYHEAVSNLERATALVAYHAAKHEQAQERFRGFPPREHGATLQEARLHSGLACAVDYPAMAVSVEAMRIAGLFPIIGLAAAATAVSGIIGWELGAAARCLRDPERPNAFQVGRLAVFTAVAFGWIIGLFWLRTNAAFVLNPLGNLFLAPAIAAVLTLMACAAIGRVASLAYHVESPRAAEARIEAAYHKKAQEAAERAQAIYAHDVQIAKPPPDDDDGSAIAVATKPPVQPSADAASSVRQSPSDGVSSQEAAVAVASPNGVPS
jgi:hypothetical protein